MWKLISFAACGALLIASCGAGESMESAPVDKEQALPDDDSRVARVHNDYAVPAESLADLASFGEIAIVFEVNSIERAPIDSLQRAQLDEERKAAEEEGNSDYEEILFVSKRVEVRTVEVVWKRHDLDALTIPDQFFIDTAGWIVKDGQQTEFVEDSAPILHTGSRYFAVLSQFDKQWAPLTAEILALVSEDGKIAVDPKFKPPPAMLSLGGLSPAAAGEQIAKTPLYPELATTAGGSVIERGKLAGRYWG